MDLFSIGFVSGGVLLLYSGIRGINPAELFKAIIAGGKVLPSPGSWYGNVTAGIYDSHGNIITDNAYTPTNTAPSNDPRRQAVLAEAAKYLGIRYVFGGDTPRSGFDCSGFTVWVFSHAIHKWLPRTSILQSLRGTAKPLAQALPGDLIFFGSPVHHVGIYVGDDQIIHAPHTGTVVKYETIWHTETITCRDVIGAPRKAKGNG